MSTVLYLSGNSALWVRFKHRKRVDLIEEPVSLEAMHAFEPCHVHLLVDTELSEIDAHPLLATRSGLRYRANQRALQRGLIERFPDAIVQSAPQKAMLGTVLVQHINLPEPVREWLSAVQRGGVTVCSVTSISELLAHHCAAGEVAGGYIVINANPDFTRHTFCQAGYALFTRVVASSESQEQFEQTLAHLKASALISEPAPVFCVGVSNKGIDQINGLELVAEVTGIETSNKSTGLFFAELLLASKTLRTNHAHRQVSFAMEPFSHQRRRTKKIYHYAAAWVLVAASLGYAVKNEWQRATTAERVAASQSELRQAIALYKNEALVLTPQSVVLSSALIDRVSIESAMGLSPAILLTVLAEAFTQYRELELQELRWAVVESGSVGSAATKVTQVNLAGTINRGDSLRAQQAVFNDFTALLRSHDELSNLTVLQTPLTPFDGGVPFDSAYSKQAPRFELEFELNRVAGNDA